MNKRNKEHFRGCLLGGAIGDALGWPVEFKSLRDIINKYGPNGITNLTNNAEITDDTQMTLFTAEGILRAETRGREKGICHIPSVVYNSYQRWVITQGYQKLKDKEWIYDGLLLEVKELHHRRAPGNTCISALLSGKQGAINEPINNSKGCGGVMRVAPVGLFYPKERAFEITSDIAALTHGHPSGYLSAGALAYIIANIIEGETIEKSVLNSLIKLEKFKYHEETYNALKKAIDLTKQNINSKDAIKSLGEGWVGEEALAISVYSAIKYVDDFKKALITAVNHDGDSDSTGSITGNILGAYLGIKNITKDWITRVELKDVIIKISDDLLTRYEDSREWWNKYPGY